LLFRVSVNSNKISGINKDSQIMVDKINTIKADKGAKKIGKLSSNEVLKLDKAIKLWLDLN